MTKFLQFSLGLLSLTTSTAFAQTTGDMAFVGFNGDGEDDFAIVTFVDIPANTDIFFRDEEWSGTAFTSTTGEGYVDWNTGSAIIPAGTVVSFNNVSGSSPSVTVGTLVQADMGISASKEGIFCFTGTDHNTPTTFITAITNGSVADGYGDLAGTGLTLGSTAQQLPSSTDIAQYVWSRSGLTIAEYQEAINKMDNWAMQAASGDQSVDGTNPDIPFDGTVFTFNSIKATVDTDIAYTYEKDGTYQLDFKLDTPSSDTVKLYLSYVDFTAEKGVHFNGPEQVVFNPGQTSTSATIALTNDNADNGDLFFTVQIDRVFNASKGDDTECVAYLYDNDRTAMQASNEVTLEFVKSFEIDASGSAEIVMHDPTTEKLFVANSTANKLEIIDFSDANNLSIIKSVDLASYGAGINSLAIHNGHVATGIEAANFANGKVVFFDMNGDFVSEVEVGVLPDMVAFTPDGTKLLTANEGQPSDDYTTDPEGTVSVVDVSGGFASLTNANVTTLDFNDFDADKASLESNGVRIYGPGASVSQDVEPEYISFSSDSKKAYVSLQENNAIAIVNLETMEISEIMPLGTKDHSLTKNGFDASDKIDSIAISAWPLKGMYMPDGITIKEMNGKTYLLTANEGDARDYDAYSEEEKISKITLDSAAFPNAEILQRDDVIGRLKISTAYGDTDNDGDFDELYSYGSRSFTIFDVATGDVVFDSKNDFERIIAEHPVWSKLFNASNSKNSVKNRSDNKGPEPEAIITATINNEVYAFIGLERIGGVMVYNITDPANATYVTYVNSREVDSFAGDHGAEGLIYISANNSPNDTGLVVTANEVSSTLAIYKIKEDLPNALETVRTSTELNLYPNPAQHVVYFNQPISFTLFDISGKAIVTMKKAPKLNVAGFQKGIYFIQTTTGETKKLIVE